MILPHTPAITIWQPWATLIAMGKKKYETRDWDSGYYGSLVIHAASKKVDFDAVKLIALALKDPSILDLEYPIGCVVAVVDLIDTIHMDTEFIASQSEKEIAQGLWKPGRFAWKFGRVQKTAHIPAKGQKGLWEPGKEIISKIQFHLWEERKLSLSQTENRVAKIAEDAKHELSKKQKKLKQLSAKSEILEFQKAVKRLCHLLSEIEIWQGLNISKEYRVDDREVILEDKFLTPGNFPSVWVSDVGSDDFCQPYLPSQLTVK